MPPKISVCMPVSRDGPWFREALTSALRQSEPDLEVIVADDSGGSLEAFVDRCDDNRLRYFANLRPRGFAGNHCFALDQARGTFVAFLHDDDVWECDYLASALVVLERDLDVGFVLSGAMEIDARGSILGRRPTTMVEGVQSDPLSAFLQRDFMMLLPSLSLFRGDALEANVRPWPDVIAADLTMYVDVVLAGWRVYYLEAPRVRYRTHPAQIGTNDLAHRHALVTVWKRYAFESAVHEQQRRRRLAQALVARAGVLVKLGRTREARRDLCDARSTSPFVTDLRWWLLFALCLVPFLTTPVSQVRSRYFDRVRHRHRG